MADLFRPDKLLGFWGFLGDRLADDGCDSGGILAGSSPAAPRQPRTTNLRDPGNEVHTVRTPTAKAVWGIWVDRQFENIVALHIDCRIF